MKGLIFNILSELSERAGCQDDAWEVALAGAAMGDDEYVLEEDVQDRLEERLQEQLGQLGQEEDLEDAEALELSEEAFEEVEVFEMPYMEGEWGDSFRFLLRSARPFSDRDWEHLPGTPVPFGSKGERRSEPPHERGSFRPDADTADPYAILMRSLGGAKR